MAVQDATLGLMGGVYTLFCGFYILIGLLALASLVGLIWAVIEILKAKNENNWKIIWLLVVLLLGIIGVGIYYFIGRKERKI